MVVDDDPISNMLCEHILRRLPVESEIQLYAEPMEALKAIEENYKEPNHNKATVLFLDINMPSMSGWDFLAAFEQLSSHIQRQFRIYMLSSSVDQRDKEQARANQLVSGFVVKPLKLPDLGELLAGSGESRS